MAVAALVVEDDTGLDDADAYVDEAYVETYFENKNDVTFTAATADEKTAAVRVATQFFDAEWGPRAKDEPTYEFQALVFPRNEEAVPTKLKQAICELSKMALSGPLAGVGATVNSPSADQISSVKAGSVEVAFREKLNAAVETMTANRFYLIEKLVAGFLKSGGINTGSSR